MPVFLYERSVRFEEVDAAGIVFFARFLSYGHEAMEAFFGALPGGYHDVVVRRRIGFPAVHVEADYAAPLRFGDTLSIALDITKIGTTSFTLRYRMKRQGDVRVATILHTCVCCDLSGPTKIPFPDDIRALLERYGSTD
jgi:4-hydroxybenzoyl-CoA thioesterase